MAWTVYTFWNTTGDVIYAGMSSDVDGRIARHSYIRTWFGEVSAVRKVEFTTERDARDAEYSIIAAELPRYNDRGRDICPRCRERVRGNNRKHGYCNECQASYQIARRRALGINPVPPPTVTCPRCGGLKRAGPSYCRSCKKDVNALYRKNKSARNVP